MVDTCKLCGKEKALRKSHIIPEFLYAPTYDEKHRAKISNPALSSTRTIQKGLREHLLCDCCESGLGELERRVAGSWKFADRVGEEIYSFPMAEYSDTKLFSLSVLWRSSVSSRDEFKFLSLGAHEEQVRRMLRAENPGPSMQFPISGRFIISPDDRVSCSWLILSPCPVTCRGFDGWMFVFGGLAWLCTPGCTSLALERGALPKVGNWELPVVPLDSLETLQNSF